MTYACLSFDKGQNIEAAPYCPCDGFQYARSYSGLALRLPVPLRSCTLLLSVRVLWPECFIPGLYGLSCLRPSFLMVRRNLQLRSPAASNVACSHLPRRVDSHQLHNTRLRKIGVCPGRPYSSSDKKEADRTGRYPGAPVPTGRARLRASGEPRHVYVPGWRPGIDDMAPPSTGRHAGVVSLSFSQLFLAWNFLSGWVPSAVPLVRRRKLFYVTCRHGMFKRNQRLPLCGASGLLPYS